MAFMLKSGPLGFYNVEYDEETGEIINDPMAPKPEPEKPKPAVVVVKAK